LILMSQVQIIDTTDQRLEALLLLQRASECGNQSGLPGSLDAIEADEKGTRRVSGLVEGEAREDERDAEGRFVVYDGGVGANAGGCKSSCHLCGLTMRELIGVGRDNGEEKEIKVVVDYGSSLADLPFPAGVVPELGITPGEQTERNSKTNPGNCKEKSLLGFLCRKGI
jgi:hypothetical protein